MALIQDLIATYFPEPERDRASCIVIMESQFLVESPPSRLIDALTLLPGEMRAYMKDEGMIDCGQGEMHARSYGPFGLVDVCWDPAMNPASLFTPAQWALVKADMEWNIWGAAIVWSNGGWRAWSTCPSCDACDVTGGPILYPRGPVSQNGQILPARSGSPLLATATVAGLVLLGILDG